MPNGKDDDLYDLRITFRVKIKKWRVDDQTKVSNRNWSLNVYDEVQGTWVNTIGGCGRPGEETYIENLEVL